MSFDRELGLCMCQVSELEKICNRECRISQKKKLQYVCSDPVKIRLTYQDGKYVRGNFAIDYLDFLTRKFFPYLGKPYMYLPTFKG